MAVNWPPALAPDESVRGAFEDKNKMPFCKRITAPKDVCKEDAKRQGVIFTDLGDVCEFALCSILRQLSDLSRQSVSILEELEGELASVCLRSRTLASKVVSLRKHLSVLVIKPPPLSKLRQQKPLCDSTVCCIFQCA